VAARLHELAAQQVVALLRPVVVGRVEDEQHRLGRVELLLVDDPTASTVWWSVVASTPPEYHCCERLKPPVGVHRLSHELPPKFVKGSWRAAAYR